VDPLDQLISDLQALDFTEYEARLYVALLRQHPVTRYQLSKSAGIPTAKVYETIDRLERRGFVTPANQSDRPTYIPLPPGEVIRQIKAQTDRRIQSASTQLEAIAAQNDSELQPLSWNLEGYERIMGKARNTLDRSVEYVMCAMWEQEVNELLPNLQRAQERGVQIVLLAYGTAPEELGIVHQHGMEATLLEQTGGRWLVLATEALQEVVIGFFPADNHATGVWAQSPILNMIAKKYIREHFASHGIDLFEMGQ
jgi:sugar-specific transcriptional regulator TrmB